MRQQGHSNRQWGQDIGIIGKTRHVHPLSQALKGANDWGPAKVSGEGVRYTRGITITVTVRVGKLPTDGTSMHRTAPSMSGGCIRGGLAVVLISVLPCVCVIVQARLPVSVRGLDVANDGISVPITLVILTVHIRSLISNTMSIPSLRRGPISYFQLSLGWAWGICGDFLHSIVGCNGGDIPTLGRAANNSGRVSLTFSLSFPLSFSLPLPFAEGLVFT